MSNRRDPVGRCSSKSLHKADRIIPSCPFIVKPAVRRRSPIVSSLSLISRCAPEMNFSDNERQAATAAKKISSLQKNLVLSCFYPFRRGGPISRSEPMMTQVFGELLSGDLEDARRYAPHAANGELRAFASRQLRAR